jgi:hypothetical protein
MKKAIITTAVLLSLYIQTTSFCGFYVAKADVALKNKASQVILVRDGDRTVVTMNNDFKGDLSEFAMVVPVPVVLKKEDVKVLDNGIFQRLNDYSAPRLVEYYDQTPCNRAYKDEMKMSAPAAAEKSDDVSVLGYGNRRAKGVTVEAQYTVGEYDITILGAKESTGLKEWLTDNGYKIPESAEEVLQPYIKSNLKFFVVKVNLDAKAQAGTQYLRPIQIKFSSPKFMLPIRLGMANADGDQDMIVYAYSRKGRVECTNYRTVSAPTGKNIPLFVQKNFGVFYNRLFDHQWNKEGKSVAFLEYAWDVSPQNYMKCDPCVSEPPNFNDMREAGVWWLDKNAYDDYVNEYEEDKKNVYFTRLHVRYNRKSFPQDLVFQVTPNKENFQARYIITHPATGDLNCPEGKKYLKQLKERRRGEMEQLAYLTGSEYNEWESLSKTEDEPVGDEAAYSTVAASMPAANPGKANDAAGYVVAGLLLAGAATANRLRVFKKK